MSLSLKFATSAIFIASSLYAQEVTIKPLPNVSVAYHLTVEGNTVQKSKNGAKPANLGHISLIMDFNLEVVQGKEIPELVLTPQKLIFHNNSMGITFGFDSTAIPVAHSPELKLFHDFWGTPIRLPLTTDPTILNSPSDIYPILPLHDTQDYTDLVKHILTYLSNGEHYKPDEILWDINEQNQFSNKNIEHDFKMITKGIVKEINSKSVIILGNLNITNTNAATTIGDHTADVSVNAEATMNINRENSLLRQMNGTATIKIAEDHEQKGAPILRDGDIQLDIKFNLSSKRL